jgi:hypothetical protein
VRRGALLRGPTAALAHESEDDGALLEQAEHLAVGEQPVALAEEH